MTTGVPEDLVLYDMTPTGKYGVALVTIGGLLVWLFPTGYANGPNFSSDAALVVGEFARRQ